MLTDREMLKIAQSYLKSRAEHFEGSDIERVIITEETIKKTYSNIYDYQSKKYVLTGDLNKALSTSAPFLVEKKTGESLVLVLPLV